MNMPVNKRKIADVESDNCKSHECYSCPYYQKVKRESAQLRRYLRRIKNNMESKE